MTFQLPYPPSVNNYWHSTVMIPSDPRKKPFVKVYISEAGTKFRKAVRQEIMVRGNNMLLGGKLAIVISVHPPDKRRRDIDNLLKALLDALQEAHTYHDDNQLWDIRIIRRGIIENGRLVISIDRYEDPDQEELF